MGVDDHVAALVCLDAVVQEDDRRFSPLFEYLMRRGGDAAASRQ